MRHRVIAKLEDFHPYELLKVEIVPLNSKESEILKSNSVEIENYLISELNAITIVESNPPIYVIKKQKDRIGI